MQSESTNLERSLLGHLKCPVCTDYMRPPIILCANGHNICNICKPQMYHCPTCRGQFLNTRNVALEDLARQVVYRCKYRSHGCTEILSHDTIGGHQATCRYSPQVCPVAKLAIGNCMWTGSYSDIKGHLQENHFEICDECAEGSIKFRCRLTDDMWRPSFIFAHNEVFFHSFSENYNILHVVVQYIGPAENAAKYKYRVKFVNKDGTEGVTVMHLTGSADENLGDIYRSGNCGKLNLDVVLRLRDEGYLNFNVDIIRVRKRFINAV